MRKRIMMALCAALFIATTPALADDNGRSKRGHGNGDAYWQDQYRDGGQNAAHHKKRHKKRHKKHYKKHHKAQSRHGKTNVAWHGGHHWTPPAKHHHRHHRHHGYRSGPARWHGDSYGRRHRDDDWVLYTVLALQIVDVLNESQRQSYAWAQHGAATAPIGEKIRWDDGGAHGSVVATREGNDTSGRYCREFQQDIYVGNERQSGYGVACRQPDGAWEIVS